VANVISTSLVALALFLGILVLGVVGRRLGARRPRTALTRAPASVRSRAPSSR
jgi:hypothetical protein